MESDQLKNMIVGFVIALVLAIAFYLASIQIGGYEDIDVQGGAFYTFVLSLIISLAAIPKLASAFRKKEGGA